MAGVYFTPVPIPIIQINPIATRGTCQQKCNNILDLRKHIHAAKIRQQNDHRHNECVYKTPEYDLPASASEKEKIDASPQDIVLQIM